MELNEIKEIILSISNGNKESYRKVILDYQDDIYALCNKYLQSEEDASEVTQNVFVKAYTSLNQFRFKSEFNTWLYRIAYNLCIDFHRQKKRIKTKHDLLADNYEEIEMNSKDNDDLLAIIHTLKPKYRDVILLFYFQDLQYSEIAKIMKIQIDNVKILLFRAKQQLKLKIGNQGISK